MNTRFQQNKSNKQNTSDRSSSQRRGYETAKQIMRKYPNAMKELGKH